MRHGERVEACEFGVGELGAGAPARRIIGAMSRECCSGRGDGQAPAITSPLPGNCAAIDPQSSWDPRKVVGFRVRSASSGTEIDPMDAGWKLPTILPTAARMTAKMKAFTRRTGPIAASAVLLSLAGCAEKDDAAGILSGARNGDRGAPCVSYMDCKVELECVDGVCGIFGEASSTHAPGGACDVPGSTPTSGGNQNSEPEPGPGANATTTTGGAPATTSTTTTNTTTSTTSGGGVTTTTTPDTSSGGGQDTTDPDEVPLACRNLPVEFQKKKNLYSTTEKNIVTEGFELYHKPKNAPKKCSHGKSCHNGGSGQGGGNSDATDLTSERVKNQPDCALYYYTLKGVEDTLMPAYEDNLSEDDIWKIITFIRSLQEG